MLLLSNQLLNRKVLSLRLGGQVAIATEPIINPDNFKIEGFYCDTPQDGQLILLWQDVREVLADGYVIDDYERLAEAEDLVRLKEVLAYQYSPIDKQVVTIDKHKVGKVSDYAIDSNSMYIQKVYCSQSILKSLTGGSLSIDRSQIHEVTPEQIIITELQGKEAVPAAAPAG